jgi:GNAT superfamily N-acetyltransferase
MTPETKRGLRYDPAALDLVERHFWRDVWESVPGSITAEHGIELRRFGALQATIVRDLAHAPMLNLILGAAEAGEEDLAGAIAWAEQNSVSPYLPVTPGRSGSARAEAWLQEHGFEPAYAWMKFVRDPHPPRFPVPAGIEVAALNSADEEPFGAIAALGFGLPAWGAELFARLPEADGWHCYVAKIDGKAQACAAMLIADGAAELGIAATLEAARGRGCQTALLHRRIVDAAGAGCNALFVRTGERVPGRPSASYRNILRAGFEEACLRPNWQRRP